MERKQSYRRDRFIPVFLNLSEPKSAPRCLPCIPPCGMIKAASDYSAAAFVHSEFYWFSLENINTCPV